MDDVASQSLKAFRPARSKLEAVTRISALTGSPPETLGPGSKERKSTLVNLALGLRLPVDTTATKPALGAQIAASLGVQWNESSWSAGQTITLAGLNAILSGAQTQVASRRSATQLALFEALQPSPTEFIEARSKLEAVTRISALTHSPPETLGPGSKERKSVLVNLGRGLGLAVDASANKPTLGAQIAAELDVPWDSTCWSAGHTITLHGLNVLLGGAQKRLAVDVAAGGGLFLSAHDEAAAMLGVLASAVPANLDGRACIAEMHAAQYTQWAQDEWAAFYFEFVGLPALINAFGGGPRTFVNTRFDYGLSHTWDLKVHMATGGVAPLNDCVAMEAALTSGSGVGFVVLSGEVLYDQGDFREWQKLFRQKQGKKATRRVTPPKYLRRSKQRFHAMDLEAFYLPDTQALTDALTTGVLKVMRQGAQTSGEPRPPKYSIDLVRARRGRLLLAHRQVDPPRRSASP